VSEKFFLLQAGEVACWVIWLIFFASSVFQGGDLAAIEAHPLTSNHLSKLVVSYVA